MAEVQAVQTAPKPKKVPRPDQKAFEAQVATLQAEFQVLQDRVAGIKKTIDESRNSPKGQESQITGEREKLKAIREERERLQKERDALVAMREARKKSIDSQLEANKTLRTELKYPSVDKIEEAVQALLKRQSTTSMTLNEEKKLVKEVELLNASKKAVERYNKATLAVEAERATLKDVQAALKDKLDAIHAANTRFDAQRAVVDKMSAALAEKAKEVPALAKARDEARAAANEKYLAIQKLRLEHKKANDEWYAADREFRLLQNAKRVAEAAAAQAEREAIKAEREKELAQEKPWQSELALITFLRGYLHKLAGPVDAAAATPAASAAGPADTITDKSGKVLRAFKREEDSFLQISRKGKGSEADAAAKRAAAEAAKKAKKDAAPLIHNLDTVATFRQLKLTAPTTRAAIAASITELDALYTYYDTLPRTAPKGKTAVPVPAPEAVVPEEPALGVEEVVVVAEEETHAPAVEETKDVAPAAEAEAEAGDAPPGLDQ